VQAIISCADQPDADLGIYLSKNGRFKSFIYDRKEIQSIASNLGLAPDYVRAELRKLGYCLIMNNHGRMVWKRMAQAYEVQINQK
jgi:hypothetical protein